MLIRIDVTSNVPIFAQIAASVRRAIADGDLAPGDRLASARDLAKSLDVNLHTVLRGYQELRDEGIIELRRGRGAVVTTRAKGRSAALLALTAYIEEARRAGLTADEATRLVREGMNS
ncbi:MAG TPA: GntR family transcriptional regulator [Phycicoccus sp.]|nr:GntR family transcriptional regulator [Phycicoccus sp.]